MGKSLIMNFPFQAPSPATVSVAEITRLIRRICLLREQNNMLAAEQLEQNEFAAALRDLLRVHGPELLTERELLEIFRVEEKRVADAAVLAELITPQIARALASVPLSLPPARLGATAVGARDTAIPFSRAAVAGTSPMIADLLDAMLATERPANRP